MSNKSQWTDVFRESQEYIRKLRTGGQLVINTPRRTFALGFIIDIQSFQGLATDLLTNIDNPLKYFLTYKVSQDRIELYFCCLRSRGGWNNNPSLLQALWSIRRLLYRNSIKPSSNANCESLDFETTPIFEFRSSKTQIINEEKEFREEKMQEEKKNDEIVEELMSALESEELSFYQENILYYIAGFVVQKFIKKCTCSHCNDLVLSTFSTDHTYADFNVKHPSAFLTFVNRGKLCIPSYGIFEIVKYCEKTFRAQINLGDHSVNFKDKISHVASRHFAPMIPKLFPFSHPVFETMHGCCEPHEMKIIKTIASDYFKIRLRSYAKAKTLDFIGSKATLRQKLSKTILFYHVQKLIDV